MPSPRRTASAPIRLGIACLLVAAALPLAGCGWDHHHYDYDGNVFVDNRTNTTTPEQATAFRLAAFGDPFTGNLLGSPLDAGNARQVGRFHSDYYDAEADMFGGDLVEWFDRWVGASSDTFFDIY